MRHRSAGFTLIEVLVAVAIFALISAMAYGALNQVLRVRDRVDAEREFWKSLSLTWLLIEDDLRQARARPVRDEYGNIQPAFVGQPTDTRALGSPSVMLTRGGVLITADMVRSDLQRVAWRLEEDHGLRRLTWPMLDRAPVSTEPAAPTPLLTGVNEFKLRFLNSDGRWLEVWPPLEQTAGNAAVAALALPRGVEVTLDIQDRGRMTRLFVVQE